MRLWTLGPRSIGARPSLRGTLGVDDSIFWSWVRRSEGRVEPGGGGYGIAVKRLEKPAS